LPISISWDSETSESSDLPVTGLVAQASVATAAAAKVVRRCMSASGAYVPRVSRRRGAEPGVRPLKPSPVPGAFVMDHTPG